MRIAVDEGRRQLPQCARSRPLPRSHAPPPAWPPSGGQAGEPHPSSSAIDSAANKYVKPRNQHYRHLNAVLYRRSQGRHKAAARSIWLPGSYRSPRAAAKLTESAPVPARSGSSPRADSRQACPRRAPVKWVVAVLLRRWAAFAPVRTALNTRAGAPTLARCLGRVARHKVVMVQGTIPPKCRDQPDAMCRHSGFQPARCAALRCDSDERQRLEQLCRHIKRPAFADELTQRRLRANG